MLAETDHALFETRPVPVFRFVQQAQTVFSAVLPQNAKIVLRCYWSVFGCPAAVVFSCVGAHLVDLRQTLNVSSIKTLAIAGDVVRYVFRSALGQGS